jgi:hypothetical protein
VVLIHGADTEKSNWAGNTLQDAAVLFASHGIAAWIYAKRGNGNSSGGLTKANFTDLVDDALAEPSSCTLDPIFPLKNPLKREDSVSEREGARTLNQRLKRPLLYR